MGCPASVEIGDNLVFSICTHDPDTGVLTDADSNPAYRIYEDETATPILTGTMGKLDDDNTTGFYTELIACTSENGFEDNKNYTIYIIAIVDSDTGGISYTFKVTRTIGIKKGKALSNFTFYMVAASDHITGIAGATIVSSISKDGSDFTNCTNNAESISSGLYKIDLTATEMNANVINLKFSESTCDTRIVTIETS